MVRRDSYQNEMMDEFGREKEEGEKMIIVENILHLHIIINNHRGRGYSILWQRRWQVYRCSFTERASCVPKYRGRRT